MAFVAEISNRQPAGFQVESLECSTVNGFVRLRQSSLKRLFVAQG